MCATAKEATQKYIAPAVGVCRLSKARPGRLPAAALFSIVLYICIGRKMCALRPVSKRHSSPGSVRNECANIIFRFLDLSQCGYPHFPIFRHSCTRLQSAAVAADMMRALPGASCQILGHHSAGGQFKWLATATHEPPPNTTPSHSSHFIYGYRYVWL